MTKWFLAVITMIQAVQLGLAQTPEKDKRDAFLHQQIEDASEQYADIAMRIWGYAELGYQEKESSALLASLLEENGFQIERGVADIPTAFTATFGSGKPVIGILGEFDALPGISQSNSPEREVIEDKANGHACGHHLFGTGSAAAVIAAKAYLESSGQSGTIRFYGTPAEEGGAGKVYLVRAGLLDDLDIALHWHPGSSNQADASSSLANKSAKFRFYGKSAHASSAPDRGRSALDGVEAMNYMVNMMREHIPDESRIHYVITRGGEAPNVIPDFAEVFYYCRHPEAQEVHKTFEWLVQAAEGAAMGTQTRMEYEIIHGAFNLLPNEALGRLVHTNLLKVGGVYYDETEMAFAERISTSFDNSVSSIESAKAVKPFKVIERGSGGSTDVGDVSWVVPTAGMRAATWVPGTAAHSWQAIAAGGTSIGAKGMIVAAKTLASTMVDLINDEATITASWEELRRRRGDDFTYKSMVGDRKPPLDYRD